MSFAEDAPAVDFALTRGRAARISGVALDATGNSIHGGLVLSRSYRSESVAAAIVGADISANGAFEFANVLPGDYVLQATKTRVDPYTEGEFASVLLTVTGTDITGLVVRMKRGSTVSGHVTLDGLNKRIDSSAVDLSARPVDPDLSPLASNPPASGRMRQDWTFSMSGLSGLRLFRAMHLSQGWALQAVLLNGRDVTDTPLAFGDVDQSVNDLEVVLTDRVSGVSGRVLDARGRGVADATIVVFDMDRQHWSATSRFLATATTGLDGSFSVLALPAGQYFAAAVDRIVDGEWQNPEFLATLVQDASTVSLNEGQALQINPKLLAR